MIGNKHKFYCTCTECTLTKIYRNIKVYRKEVVLFRHLYDTSMDEYSKNYFAKKIQTSIVDLKDLVFYFIEMNMATEEEITRDDGPLIGLDALVARRI